ncbi:SOS (error prone) mutagenesis protein UmuD (RumA) [Legionella londiniensis]|uniref:SOS error prone mutagenesis protein UmuD (RumA) n=2 Tax=Legionella londiniensis TaxID=45068 RepID=A0A0W0VQT9_9GAMM|nr:SOS error prone mutagenesis protein UmuD (RumA) [Legionella londiniensis]STX93355.1 SOS (error prone) mutagenesis protein UmuD (RumA) [Legionella londiniensis]
MAYLENTPATLKLPLYSSSVGAGFPSPADDYLECKLDLNAHLVKHPGATFFVRVAGDPMENAGIRSGDMLMVDRSLEPAHGKIGFYRISSPNWQ